METVNVKSNDLAVIAKEIRSVSKELQSLNRWLRNYGQPNNVTDEEETEISD